MGLRGSKVLLSVLMATLLASAIQQQEAWCESPRQLAPGVLRVVDGRADAADTVSDDFSLHGLVRGSQPWTPSTVPASETLHELAQRVTLHRPIWQLEFGYKPLRMIRTSWQEADGTTREGLVWYLVYYVRNTGQHLTSVPQTEGWKTEYTTAPADHVVRFLPTLVLQAHDRKKAYLDSVRPQVMHAIHRREDPDIRLFNSVDISRIPLTSSPDDDGKVWGVATWLDVDPQIDFFSIYVQGLTNAYRWQELDPGKFRADSPADVTRRLQPKTLQINFYRPSDAEHEHENEVRVGVPSVTEEEEQTRLLAKYRLDRPLEHLWVYR